MAKVKFYSIRGCGCTEYKFINSCFRFWRKRIFFSISGHFFLGREENFLEGGDAYKNLDSPRFEMIDPFLFPSLLPCRPPFFSFSLSFDLLPLPPLLYPSIGPTAAQFLSNKLKCGILKFMNT